MFNKEVFEKIRLEIPDYIRVMGVTKNKPIQEIIEAINSGIKIIGENYIKEAEDKYEKLKEFFKERNISFHLIGHLQSNKVKTAVRIFDCIETLDSLKLAEKINHHCDEINKKIDVMIEINFDENKKSGIQIEELDSFLREINNFQNINLIGLMCIPQIGEEECFKKMKDLKEKYKLEELSMGMSSDYKTAIEKGATIIRLGRILFGRR